MEYISYSFILFVVAGLVLYALLPKLYGRYVLLLGSLLFVWLSGGALSLVFLCEAIAISFFGAWLIEKAAAPSVRRALFIAVLMFLLFSLFYFKYQNFPEYTKQLIYYLRGMEYEPVLTEREAPLGISFYTLMLISYVADVYRRACRPEASLAGFALYGSYFGHIVQGPMDAYEDVGKQLSKDGGIRYQDLCDGALLLSIGLFKKLVISERLNIFVNSVFADQYAWHWSILLLGAAAFSLQLYTDFSGCMDIVSGVSRMFGIRLSLNFRQPFFSQSISEFWRRWHITLGAFFRKYIYIPLGGNRKGSLRKFLNTMAVFLLSGLWHGGNWTFVIGTGLLHCAYMALGMLTKPFTGRLLKALHISDKSRGLHVIRSLWVFVLVTIGFVFFRSDTVASAVDYLGGILSLQQSAYEEISLSSFGLAAVDIWILILGLAALFLLSLASEMKETAEALDSEKQAPLQRGSVQDKHKDTAEASASGGRKTAALAGLPGPLGAICISRKENAVLLLLLIVIIFGCYGRGYDASAFIYANF